MGVEIFIAASRYRNWDKLRSDGPLGFCVDVYSISVSWKKNMQTSKEGCSVEKLLLRMTTN